MFCIIFSCCYCCCCSCCCRRQHTSYYYYFFARILLLFAAYGCWIGYSLYSFVIFFVLWRWIVYTHINYGFKLFLREKEVRVLCQHYWNELFGWQRRRVQVERSIDILLQESISVRTNEKSADLSSSRMKSINIRLLLKHRLLYPQFFFL